MEIRQLGAVGLGLDEGLEALSSAPCSVSNVFCVTSKSYNCF